MPLARNRRTDAIVREAARLLSAAGIDTPLLDARLLVAAATGRDAAGLIVRGELEIGAGELARLDAMLARRCRREPVARILGEREFYGRAFKVTPDVLDPRPDSETLIEEALAIAAAEGWRERRVRILDVGTGSGALLVTLLAELPHATGLGTDTSEAALRVAAANAARHGVAARAAFAWHDALDGVGGPFDLVICNPPYIATGDIAGLAPEVREHDPHGALDGGGDGLDVYRKIIPQLPAALPCGWALFEVGAGQGAGQADAVTALLREKIAARRVKIVRRRRDLAGHDRCVAMQIQL